MPANRNALIRYKTIDACLRNRQRKWTLDALVDAVSAVLYDYEGIDKGISRRTIQADLQLMRSDKLGYYAPIIVQEKKYYTYDDPTYSITNLPLSESDLTRLNQAVDVLKQFRGFSHFDALQTVVQRLEDHVYVSATKTVSVIDFEKNEHLKGLHFLDVLYQAVVQQRPVQLTYQSFSARSPQSFPFHVWWLKEFKNRWFAVGVQDARRQVMNLALDRIQQVAPADPIDYLSRGPLDPETYYRHVVGVTVDEHLRVTQVKLLVNHAQAPYLETKPLHPSQRVLERRNDGVVLLLDVQLNHELEREILSFGEAVTVLAPERLRKRIRHRLMQALNGYGTD
ncbi:WYL domain-containing protein [Spirosoma luteolum]